MLSFSGVTFVLFRFRLYAFVEAAALRSIVLRYAYAPTTTRSYLTTVCVLFSFLFLPFFRFFGDVAFPEYFCTTTAFSLYGGYTPYGSPFRMVVFCYKHLVTTGRIFDMYSIAVGFSPILFNVSVTVNFPPILYCCFFILFSHNKLMMM